MTLPLRQRHRVVVCILGALLPVVFATGIARRKPVPVAATAVWESTDKMNHFGQVVWRKPDLWPGQHIITSLRRNVTGSLAVELMFRELLRPDLLLYWAAGKESATQRLPNNARLVGAVSNRTPLPLSSELRGEIGQFVLYSLADHEVVAVANASLIQKE